MDFLVLLLILVILDVAILISWRFDVAVFRARFNGEMFLTRKFIFRFIVISNIIIIVGFVIEYIVRN